MVPRRLLGFPDPGRFRPLVLGFLIDATGTGIFLPMTVLFFLATTDVPLTRIGLALSLGAAAAIPVAPLVGGLIDRWGAKHVLIGGNLLAGAGFAAYPLARSFAGVVVAATVVQAGMAAYRGAFGPVILAVSEPGNREGWFGLVAAVGNLGYAVGGLLAGVVLTLDSTLVYRVGLVVVAGSNLVCSTLVARAPIPVLPQDDDGDAVAEHETRGSWARVWSDRPFLLLVGINVSFVLLTLALELAMPVYLIGRVGLPGWIAGVVFTVNTVLVALGQGAALRAVRGRVRGTVLMLAGVLAVGAYLLMILAAGTSTAVGLAVALGGVLAYTGAELLATPVLDALAAEAPPARLVGRYTSVFQLSWVLGGAVAPALFAWLVARGTADVWVVLSAVALAGVGGAGLLRSRMPAAGLRVGGASDPKAP